MANEISRSAAATIAPLANHMSAIPHTTAIEQKWSGCATNTEYTLHQVSPFIGKMKSSMARALLDTFTREGTTIYDPFSGSGTVALEAWASGRNVIANDLSPYAFILTHAKLFPYQDSDEALHAINECSIDVEAILAASMVKVAPEWVQSFFHPETLREILAWVQVLSSRKLYFLSACLLGILHHQRPGFLSYPSSHTVPYLRTNRFPKEQYPELYTYRSVRDRLERKVTRALKRMPVMRNHLHRRCSLMDAAAFIPPQKIDAIVTSPPYMRQLDYARDNRLRLWFLGTNDWHSMDSDVSPTEGQFVHVMSTCLRMWKSVLRREGICVLVLGDTESKAHRMRLPDLIARIATEEVGGYSVVWKHTEAIPSERRVRRGCRGNQDETVLVLRNDRGV